MAGPEATRRVEFISTAMMPASEVLPSPGGPAKQYVFARLAAPLGGVQEDRELLLQLRLADELRQDFAAQRTVELLLAGSDQRVGQAVGLLHAHTRPASAARTRSEVGRSASTLRRESSASATDMPSPTRASRAAVWSSTPTAGSSSRDDRADLVLEVDHQALGGLSADSRDARKQRVVSDRDGSPDLVGRVARDDRQGGLGTDPRDAQQQLEQLALGGARKPEQLERVFTHVQMRYQRDLGPVGVERQPTGTRGGTQQVPHACHVQHDKPAVDAGHPAAQLGDHRRAPANVARDRATRAWQTAAASASAA